MSFPQGKTERWRGLIVPAAVVLVCSAACSARESAAEPNRAALTVRVTNGTKNGKPVASDKVLLSIYQHEKLLQSLSSEVGQEGVATFENVPAGEHVAAVATVYHQGMSFTSGVVQLPGGRKGFSVNVKVFDVSYDNSKLSAATHHLIIKPRRSDILLTEVIELVNPTDMAISSKLRDAQGNAIVVNVPLPGGFKNFKALGFLVTKGLVFTDDGFYDTMGIPPGHHHVSFSYSIDRRGRETAVTKKLSLETANFVLFWHLGDGKIEGLGDPDGQITMTDGTIGQYYNLGALPAGAEVRFRIRGSRTDAADKTSWIVLSLVFAAVAAAALLRLRRTKSPEA